MVWVCAKMKAMQPGHPFTQTCARHQCECEQDTGLGLSIVHAGNDRIAFYGDTDVFLSVMSQKRYYNLLPKMVYLAKMGTSPTFMVDKSMLWSERMMQLECDRLTDPAIMLNRFFSVAPKPAGAYVKESANALVCGFRSTGFQYDAKGSGENYELDISLTYDLTFVRRVYSLNDIAVHFKLPVGVVSWLGEAGTPPWWAAVRELALTTDAPMPEFELPALDLS